METYLKCLLKCVPPFEVCEKHLKPILVIGKYCKPLSSAYAKFFAYSVTRRDDEFKAMYAQSRIFISYDGALEGGRDQEWWFKICADRMSESCDFWAGRISPRIQYILAHDDPMKYPLAYVYWRNRQTFYTAREFVSKNRYWIAACAALALI